MLEHKTTIRDIALEAGVSISLVSFVMNGKTRGKHNVNPDTAKRILEIAERLNYQPNNAARSLRSGRTNTIGVILSDISNKFFADIARCIEDKASQYKYIVLFGSTDENPKKLDSLIDAFLNRGVDGLIIVPCEGSEKTIPRLVDMNIPLVLLDRTFEKLDVSSVVLNNRKAMVMAVDHLQSQGYRRIELVSYVTTISNIMDRERGYVQAMKQTEGGECPRVHRIKYQDIASQMAQLIPQIIRNGAEAIIFSTNRLAIESLKVLRDNNILIPRDVAIIAFDGSETFAFELYYTSISYIKQPIEQFGFEALDLIVKLINKKGDTDCSTVVLNPKLVVQNSSEMPVFAPEDG